MGDLYRAWLTTWHHFSVCVMKETPVHTRLPFIWMSLWWFASAQNWSCLSRLRLILCVGGKMDWNWAAGYMVTGAGRHNLQSHWTTNSRSFCTGWWVRLPLHHHSNALMFISSSLSIDTAHKGTRNHAVPECCCCHTQPRLTVLLLIIKAIKRKTLFTAVITTTWFISPRWLYPAGLSPAFSHIYIKQASFSESLCCQAAGRITAKNIFMTSGSSSCTSCTNQAEEMQKGADDKGSLCCLGHKETQWGSEWAADFYHSGSLSFSLTLTFAVTSSKNKLLLNYSCVNLQN